MPARRSGRSAPFPKFALLLALAILVAGCFHGPDAPGNGTPRATGSGGHAAPPPFSVTGCVPGIPPQVRLNSSSFAANATLEIRGTTMFRDLEGNDRIVGEVVNAGNTTASLATIHATVFDASGEILGNASALALRALIPRGEESPFDISFHDANASATSYDLAATWRPTNAVPVAERYLFACQLAWSNDTTSGRLRITGNLSNNASTAIESVLVVASFFGAHGDFLGSQIAAPNPDLVAGKSSSAFALTFDPRGASVVGIEWALEGAPPD